MICLRTQTNQSKTKETMKCIFPGFNLIGAIAVTALVLGCAAHTQQTENLLSAAGFRTVIANTPQRQEQLKALTPNKVSLVQRKGKNYYVYADPANNQALVGTPAEYQKYQQLRLANRLAQDELQTAQLNSWGPGLWGFPE
jgi:hypothetical protein